VAEEETLAALRRYGVTGAQGYSVPCRDLPGALARVVE
jgi:EAL domain-containing protein (putative c-di-GMP-specific phosphodiesterase class I)